MHQSGLLIYSAMKATRSRNPCVITRTTKIARKPEKMILADFLAAFVVLAIGTCVALIIFIVEKLIDRVNSKKGPYKR